MRPLPGNLIAITNRHLIGTRSLIDVCGELVSAGIPALMLREKDLSPEELLPLAQELRTMTREAGVYFIVNGCISTALTVEADAVQLGRHSFPWEKARGICGDRIALGMSCHGAEEIADAVQAAADYILLAPVYTPNSKTTPLPPLGLEGFRALAAQSPIPVYALGGIESSRGPSLVEAGAAGVAAIGCFMAASNPAAAARHFIAQMQHAPHQSARPLGSS